MRPYRDIATLATVQIACFFVLANLEPDFFLIHLYESILYIGILVMLFYMVDRWAYMIGMLASVVWLGLAYETGIIGRALQQMSKLSTADWTSNLVALGAMMTALVAVLMIVFCARHWLKEYSGLGKTRRTFFVSLGIVAVYYGTLLRFFWEMIPNAS
jgi:hypothetical protein